MTHYPNFSVPIPCPACDGEGTFPCKDFMGRVVNRICTACKGSCVMYLTEQQYAKRIGDYEKGESHRIFTTEEIKTMRRSGTSQRAYELLRKKGYTDRSVDTIARWRSRHKVKGAR